MYDDDKGNKTKFCKINVCLNSIISFFAFDKQNPVPRREQEFSLCYYITKILYKFLSKQ